MLIEDLREKKYARGKWKVSSTLIIRFINLMSIIACLQHATHWGIQP